MRGSKCLVAWQRVTRPVELGGLGVLDLTTPVLCDALALGMAGTNRPDKVMCRHPVPGRAGGPHHVQGVYDSRAGNGLQALFWHDRCTDGQYVANIAPELLQAVNHHHARKTIIAGLRTSLGR
jgi:hypothetical protein